MKKRKGTEVFSVAGVGMGWHQICNLKRLQRDSPIPSRRCFKRFKCWDLREHYTRTVEGWPGQRWTTVSHIWEKVKKWKKKKKAWRWWWFEYLEWRWKGWGWGSGKSHSPVGKVILSWVSCQSKNCTRHKVRLASEHQVPHTHKCNCVTIEVNCGTNQFAVNHQINKMAHTESSICQRYQSSGVILSPKCQVHGPVHQILGLGGGKGNKDPLFQFETLKQRSKAGGD